MSFYLLIVDADADANDTHARLFGAIGYQCVAVDSVHKAINVIHGVWFDAVFFTSRLIPIDERRFAKAARTLQPSLKIVVASASALLHLSPFVDVLIPKPFSLQAAHHKLQQIPRSKCAMHTPSTVFD